MDKQSQLKTPQALAYYTQRAAAGGGIGATVAALVSLVHSMRTGIKERAEAKNELEPDENTIVLTLPSKKAFVNDGPCNKIKKKEGSKTKHTAAVYNDQFRNPPNGRFSNKINKYAEDKATADQKVWATIFAILGGAGGYMGVNSVYNKYRKNYLNKELERSKKEYLDQVIPQMNKVSGFVEKAFGFDTVRNRINGQTKKAQFTGFRDYASSLGKKVGIKATDNALAYALLFLLAGTGGTAYLTKRILDAHRERLEGDSYTYRPPKLNRVIFKSQPGTIESPETSDAPIASSMTPEEEDHVKAAFWVIHDVVSGRNCLDKQPDLASIFKQHNTSVEKIAEKLDKSTDIFDKEVIDEMPPSLSSSIVKQVKSASFLDNIKNVLSNLIPTREQAYDAVWNPPDIKLWEAVANKAREGKWWAMTKKPTMFERILARNMMGSKALSFGKSAPTAFDRPLGLARGPNMQSAVHLSPSIPEFSKNYPRLAKQLPGGQPMPAVTDIKNLIPKLGSIKVPIIKSSQLSDLKEFVYGSQIPVPEPDYRRSHANAQRIMNDVKMQVDDKPAGEFLTEERKQIILRAIQKTIEEELRNRARKQKV